MARRRYGKQEGKQSSDHFRCAHESLPDGSSCDANGAVGLCLEGECVELDGTFPCTEQGVRLAIIVGGGPHGFDCEVPTSVRTYEEIEIDTDVILDGGGNLIIDGNDRHRVFSVAAGVTAELRRVTVTGGAALGIVEFGGGGIDSRGTLTLINSTVSGNTAWEAGGGIVSSGTLTLINSTVLGDAAVTSGTLSTTTFQGTVVDGGCVITEFGTTTSLGHNIESPGNTCRFDPDGTDQVNVDPDDLKLGPLQNNGGPNMTHALGEDSVAIDQIQADECVDAEGAPLTTDQRGEPRPETDGTMCDVGAFERQPDDQ